MCSTEKQYCSWLVVKMMMSLCWITWRSGLRVNKIKHQKYWLCVCVCVCCLCHMEKKKKTNSVSSSSCSASDSHTHCSSTDPYSPNYTQAQPDDCRRSHSSNMDKRTNVCKGETGHFLFVSYDAAMVTNAGKCQRYTKYKILQSEKKKYIQNVFFRIEIIWKFPFRMFSFC